MTDEAQNLIDEARVHLDLLQLDEAINVYIKLVKLEPANTHFRMALAELFLKRNAPYDLDNAIRQLRLSGVHFAEKGFYAKAAAVYKRIIILSPDYQIDVRFALCDMYSLMSMNTESVNQLLHILEFYRLHSDKIQELALRVAIVERYLIAPGLSEADKKANVGRIIRLCRGLSETAEKTEEIFDCISKMRLRLKLPVEKDKNQFLANRLLSIARQLRFEEVGFPAGGQKWLESLLFPEIT